MEKCEKGQVMDGIAEKVKEIFNQLRDITSQDGGCSDHLKYFNLDCGNYDHCENCIDACFFKAQHMILDLFGERNRSMTEGEKLLKECGFELVDKERLNICMSGSIFYTTPNNVSSLCDKYIVFTTNADDEWYATINVVMFTSAYPGGMTSKLGRAIITRLDELNERIES